MKISSRYSIRGLLATTTALTTTIIIFLFICWIGCTNAQISSTAMTDETAPAGSGSGDVDCTEFQSTLAYPNTDLTLNHVVVLDDTTTTATTAGAGTFSAEVVYTGQGWVGFGISPDSNMIGSLAVIGLPDNNNNDNNPGLYNLETKAISGVTLLKDENQQQQQLLSNASIEQNDTHTVLTFTLSFGGDNDDIILINPNGNNFFLVAAGSTNELGFHLQRSSAEILLSPCTPESGGGGGAVFEATPRRSYYRAHGWMAAIAWGILVPLAISNALSRHLIPVEGLWFQMHQGLNMLAIALTIAAFAVIVSEFNQKSSPEHFKATEDDIGGRHKTIGLVVFICAVLQGIGGILRPHLPAKLENGSEGEHKSSVRTFWEFGTSHSFLGYSVLLNPSTHTDKLILHVFLPFLSLPFLISSQTQWCCNSSNGMVPVSHRFENLCNDWFSGGTRRRLYRCLLERCRCY